MGRDTGRVHAAAGVDRQAEWIGRKSGWAGSVYEQGEWTGHGKCRRQGQLTGRIQVKHGTTFKPIFFYFHIYHFLTYSDRKCNFKTFLLVPYFS